MNFETLTKLITRTCYEAIGDGATIETVVAALHVVHESAMLTYNWQADKIKEMHLQNNIAGAALEETK